MAGGLGAVLRLLVVVVAAAVAGLVALFAVAAASARPPVFLAATAAGVGLATRRVPAGRRRRARVAGFAGAALVGVAVFVATALLPLGDPGCRRPS